MALTVEDANKECGSVGSKVPTTMEAADQQEEEEEEDELFEINLQIVNNIPPPYYWESYFTATSNTLLANCLLPIADVSSAVPAVAKACDHAFSWPADSFLVVETLPGKIMGVPSSLNALGLQECNKETKA